MALPNHPTISQQPYSQADLPAIIRAGDETHYDGEEIIFEATCDEVNLKREIKRHYVYAGMQGVITGLGALVYLVYLAALSGPLGCICATRVAKSWRLLLTRSRIYYMRKHHCYVCSCADTDVYVDLSDIDKIEMQTAVTEKGCCSYSHLPTTVALELKKGQRLDLLPNWCVRPLQECFIPPEETFVKLTFTHCSNAEEFVQAVQQQMQATQPAQENQL